MANASLVAALQPWVRDLRRITRYSEKNDNTPEDVRGAGIVWVREDPIGQVNERFLEALELLALLQGIDVKA